jgi:hypothetical protein|tara:strand:- start:12 stop:566 length:555 start_codon:yes stop_codon:yes gene_type:complete
MDNFNLTKYFRDQYLAEGKWVDVSPSDLNNVDDDIISLINTAYASIGGHANFSDVGDVSKEASRGADYEIIDIDGDEVIDAVVVSKDKSAGEKIVGMGHDGTSIAKRAAISHHIDKLKKPGFYIEVSGRIKDILLNSGVPQVTDPNTIKKALVGKDIRLNDDGSYKRKLGGSWHDKIMLGSPSL